MVWVGTFPFGLGQFIDYDKALLWSALISMCAVILRAKSTFKGLTILPNFIIQIIIVTCLGIFLVPFSVGSMKGIQQKDPRYSTLPILTIREMAINTKPLRMLLATD